MPTDITALQAAVDGLVADQTAFNAKVDTDLAEIQAELNGLGAGPSQAQIDAITVKVAAIRTGLADEQAKIDAVAAPPATPAPPTA